MWCCCYSLYCITYRFCIIRTTGKIQVWCRYDIQVVFFTFSFFVPAVFFFEVLNAKYCFTSFLFTFFFLVLDNLPRSPRPLICLSVRLSVPHSLTRLQISVTRLESLLQLSVQMSSASHDPFKEDLGLEFSVRNLLKHLGETSWGLFSGLDQPRWDGWVSHPEQIIYRSLCRYFRADQIDAWSVWSEARAVRVRGMPCIEPTWSTPAGARYFWVACVLHMYLRDQVLHNVSLRPFRTYLVMLSKM